MEKDLTTLEETVSEAPYVTTEMARFLALHDVPPLGSMVMWSKQIERRVDEYLNRVKLLLGEDWETRMKGKKLKVSMTVSGDA